LLNFYLRKTLSGKKLKLGRSFPKYPKEKNCENLLFPDFRIVLLWFDLFYFFFTFKFC